MSIVAHITDIASGLKAKVSNANENEENALVVATRPLKILSNKVLFFYNPTYGIDMNQSLGAAGVIIHIHDGIDNVYWTASAITGAPRWDFNSLVQAHTGAHSIDATATINADEAQFAKGVNQDLTGYTTLTGWVYIASWPITGTKEVNVYGWDVGVGQVGNIVNIGNYIDTTILNTWHKVVIPLIDMGLVNKTIDAVRIKTINIGAGLAPNYYLDDIQIQESGPPIEFVVEPLPGTWLYVDQINIIMADVLNTVLADASMYNLSYNKFLAVPELVVGLLYKEYHNGDVTLVSEFHHLLDFLQMPNTNILNTGCDGTNTWFSLSEIFGSPILLKSENTDKLSFSLRDDMDGLLKFRVSVSCREEQR